MFKISANNYIERNYLIEIDNDGSNCLIKLTKEDCLDHCFYYNFKLYGYYEGQEADLVEDCIDMYERTLKE